MKQDLENKEIFAENLQKYMDSHGVSRNKLCDDLNFPYMTVSDWLNARTYPRIDKIEMLSEYFGINKSDLIENKKHHKGYSTSVPLLGRIAAGSPIFAEENVEGYFNIDDSIGADFCLKIKGQSMMDAGIDDGDIVFIKHQNTLENGEIGAVLIDDSATLKKFYRNNGLVILQPANSEYQPQIYDHGNLMILGKLVATLHLNE